MDEKQLIQAVRKQDPNALQDLVLCHGDRLFRSACLLCGDPDEAQDLVHNTLLQALRSGHRFEGHSSLYTWLHAILLNLTRHYHRDRKRIIYDEELTVQRAIPVEQDPTVLDVKLTSGALMEALQRLSAPHREVLVLRFYENMKIDEIAGQLGVSSGTVKSRLHYAIAQMHSWLAPELNLSATSGTHERGRR